MKISKFLENVENIFYSNRGLVIGLSFVLVVVFFSITHIISSTIFKNIFYMLGCFIFSFEMFFCYKTSKNIFTSFLYLIWLAITTFLFIVSLIMLLFSIF